jgi:hypothetical protein
MGLVLVHPFDRSISKFRGNEPEGTNGIVVARNDKIDVVRIAVGIDNGNRRNTQLFCLANSDTFFFPTCSSFSATRELPS